MFEKQNYSFWLSWSMDKSLSKLCQRKFLSKNLIQPSYPKLKDYTLPSTNTFPVGVRKLKLSLLAIKVS